MKYSSAAWKPSVSDIDVVSESISEITSVGKIAFDPIKARTDISHLVEYDGSGNIKSITPLASDIRPLIDEFLNNYNGRFHPSEAEELLGEFAEWANKKK